MHPIERLRFVARAEGVPAALLVEEAALALRAFRGDPAGLVTAARRIVSRQPACGPLWSLCSVALCAAEPWRAMDEWVEGLRSDRAAVHGVDALPEEAVVVVVGAPESIVGALARRGDLHVLVIDVFGEADLVAHRLRGRGVGAEPVGAAYLGAAVRQAAESGVGAVLVEAAAFGAGVAVAGVGSLAAASVARALGVPVWLVAGRGTGLPSATMEVLARRVADADGAAADDWEPLPLELVDAVVGATGPIDVAAALSVIDTPSAPELLVELGRV